MRRRTGPPPHTVEVEDLREKLNRKRQERNEQNAACDTTADSKRNGRRPPADPHSFLRDPLRGDEVTKDTQADNNGQRLRGHRGRGSRGRKPPELKTKPLNIIVEFSNPGERTCTIDESLEVHGPINSRRGKGHYGGRRNFRGSPRYRGGYTGRNREYKHDVNENFKSQEVNKPWNKSEKYKVAPSIETAEDWTTDDSQGAVNNNKSKDWITSVNTAEDWTAVECQGAVKDKLKDGASSIQTTEDWTADVGAVCDKSKDGVPSIQTTEDWTTDKFQEATSDTSKDEMTSVKTAEDRTKDDDGVDDNSKDSNNQRELAHVPSENAEVFSPNLEEDGKEEKVAKKKEEKVKEVDCKSNSVTV